MPKDTAPETTLERLQSLNLITRLSSDLNSQLGLNDKTLTEFIINLAEKKLKSNYKKLAKSIQPHLPIAFDVNSNVELAQEFRSTLASNGAELPLGFVSRLLGTVWEMSPRIKRFQKSIQCKRDSKVIKDDNVVGSVAKGDEKPLLSSYEHDGRKGEIGSSFPGLAVPNAAHAVQMDDFHELTKSEVEDIKRRRKKPPSSVSMPPPEPSRRYDRAHERGDRRNENESGPIRETSKRKQSNLPAWMTKNQDRNGDGNQAGSAIKRMRPESDTSVGKKSGSLEMYGIYKGKINKIMDFGIFVDLDVEPKKEGMIHISQLSKSKLNHPRDAGLRKTMSVYVKIISIGNGNGGKIMLSLKDVDQCSGKDLMPHRSRASAEFERNERSTSASASAAVVHPGLDVAELNRREEEEETRRRSRLSGMNNGYAGSGNCGGRDSGNRRRKQLTEQELFEAQQLIRSGVLGVEQYPTFDNAGGMGMLAVEETEEEAEVELAEVEPAFLRGQTRRSGKDLSPVRIVKNPDGSMQRAAMQQSSLAKERRELRTAQANSLMDSIPKDLNRPWEDPLPEAGERHFAQELRSINMSTFDGAPEWKQKAQSKTLSYGIISNKSIKEQREGLPVFRLKSELMRAIQDNQVLVVIGETGSG